MRYVDDGLFLTPTEDYMSHHHGHSLAIDHATDLAPLASLQVLSYRIPSVNDKR